MFKKYIKNPFHKEPEGNFPSEEGSILSAIGAKQKPQIEPSFFGKTMQNHAPSSALQEDFFKVDHVEEGRKHSMHAPAEMVIGRHVILKGDLSFQTLAQIDGTFEGSITTEGSMTIGEYGHVAVTCVNLRYAVIAGTFIGDIVVEQSLILKSTACIKGNISAMHLTVESGAKIQGQITVTAEK